VLCPHCGSRNVVGAMTCVVCAGALPQPQAAATPKEAPQVRPEILRARRPSPLIPPGTEGLPPSSSGEVVAHEEQVAAPAPVPVPLPESEPVPAAEAKPPPAAAVEPPRRSPPTRPTPAVGVRHAVSSSPPAVAPPSADPAPAPSGAPAALEAFEVVPGAAPLGRTIVAMLVDGVVALAPAAVVASLLAPEPSPSATLFEHVVTAMLLTPACTTAFVVTAVALHAVHFALTIPKFGSSLGGSVVGLGLRSNSGALLGPTRAAVRGLLGGVSAAVFLAGPLYALWVDAQRRSLGDLLGGTHPVRHQLGGGR
jgi:uncharacterized RDD family membrane protein YckC